VTTGQMQNSRNFCRFFYRSTSDTRVFLPLSGTSSIKLKMKWLKYLNCHRATQPKWPLRQSQQGNRGSVLGGLESLGYRSPESTLSKKICNFKYVLFSDH